MKQSRSFHHDVAMSTETYWIYCIWCLSLSRGSHETLLRPAPRCGGAIRNAWAFLYSAAAAFLRPATQCGDSVRNHETLLRPAPRCGGAIRNALHGFCMAWFLHCLRKDSAFSRAPCELKRALGFTAFPSAPSSSHEGHTAIYF